MTATTPETTPDNTAIPTVDIPTVLRNGGLPELVDILRTQHLHKNDVVAPATTLRSHNTQLVITGSEPVLDEDGVTTADGTYQITDVFLDGVASKLDIPTAYLRRLAADRPDLFDMTVNGFLRGSKVRVAADQTRTQAFGPDPRSFLVRTFNAGAPTAEGVPPRGVARALLSNRYGIVDNLDAITAMLEGVRAAGLPDDPTKLIDRAELTEQHMYLRIKCESVSALAPELLKGYRSPFTGESGDKLPTVFAGLVFRNSEVGSGAYSITPQLIVQVCNNGMTITKDAYRKTHLGARMDEGVVRWSQETANKQVELIRSQTADAVKTFLDVDYLRKVVADLEKTAGTPVADADKTIKVVGSNLKYSKEQTAGVLDHFIQGGQLTAGGVMQAVTSYAQTVDSADTQADLEASAVRAMELAAAAR